MVLGMAMRAFTESRLLTDTTLRCSVSWKYFQSNLLTYMAAMPV
jgi:hypothetical protein